MKVIPFDVGCKRIGYSPQHIRRLVREGKLKPPLRLYPDGRPFWTDQILDSIIAEARDDVGTA